MAFRLSNIVSAFKVVTHKQFKTFTLSMKFHIADTQYFRLLQKYWFGNDVINYSMSLIS